MITIGVDLAAEPKDTALAVIDWTARTVRTELGVRDERVVELALGADKIGIDCPFGWPEPFVDFVLAHRQFAATPRADTIESRREFAYRATDIWCRDEYAVRPLSVSADRIAHAALRCAGLLQRLGVTDRSGTESAIETYPAGSLRVWNLYEQGYKRSPDHTLRRVLDAARLGVATTIATDHELDALVAGITAYAAVRGLVHAVPDECRERARVEGWIALPTCSPEDLATLP